MNKLTWIVASVLLLCGAAARADLDWNTALTGEHRSEQNKARDEYRHPRETLTFLALRPA